MEDRKPEETPESTTERAAVASEPNNPRRHSMAVRTITSLAFALVTVPCAFLGGWFIFALSLILVGFGTYEILTMPGRDRFDIATKILTFIAVFALTYFQFFIDPDQLAAMGQGNLFGLTGFQPSVLGLAIYLILLFTIQLFSRRFDLWNTLYLFLMVFLLSTGFYAILFLRLGPICLVEYVPIANGFTYNLTSCLLLWWVLFGVWTCDIGAYFVGVFFGKHPMNAKISPHKTWEGFAGGVAASLIFSIVYVCIVSYACHAAILPGIIDVYNHPSDWGWVILLAVLFPLLDNVASFLFSALKRHFQAKDWGRILPGHGGIIDRFDAVILTSIVAAATVALIAG